tara:strand:+ start:86 stop:439 length:354 start_codon:yes stop_codon:yes gene_type:complete
MTQSSQKILEEFEKLLDFYNKRVRFYNTEIFILTKQVKDLEKELLAYLSLRERYKKEISDFEILNNLMCKICMENISDCIINPCKHFVCCEKCMNKLEDNKCPMCREIFEDYMKVYY